MGKRFTHHELPSTHSVTLKGIVEKQFTTNSHENILFLAILFL